MKTNRFVRLVRMAMAGVLGGVAIAAFVPGAHADEIYNIVIKKQEEKAKSRWSLADWLDTRDRMRAMDLWLALHSSNPFEGYIGGAFRDSLNPSVIGWNAYAAFYASIFGLQFQYEQLGNARMYGSFHLRFFGVHNQATNITPEFGLRNDDGPTPYRSLFLGGAVTFYFAKFFGGDFLYRHFFPSTPNAAGLAVMGDHLEGGLFVEIRLLRIYGTYFYEPGFVGTTFTSQQGFSVGGRFYL